jgi:hypothetical protein
MVSSEISFRQFVLQAIDSEMDCPVLEAQFEVKDLSQLRSVLVKDSEDAIERWRPVASHELAFA